MVGMLPESKRNDIKAWSGANPKLSSAAVGSASSSTDLGPSGPC
jgi:hypothetical protein